MDSDLLVQPLSDRLQIIHGPGGRIGFIDGTPWIVCLLDQSVTSNRKLLKRLLNAHALPVAAEMDMTSPEDTATALKKLNPPLIAMPTAGSGASATINIETEDQLEHAYIRASARTGIAVVEEWFPSITLRILVVSRCAAAACIVTPPYIKGNAQSSIRELVTDKNRLRRRNPYLRRELVRLNSAARQRLATRGIHPESILETGRLVVLNHRSAVAAGGDTIALRVDDIHPLLVQLAEQAAGCVKSAGLVGVDFLLQRVDAPPAEQRCVVSQVTVGDHLAPHAFPLLGEPVDASGAALRTYVPRDAAKVSDTAKELSSARRRPDLPGSLITKLAPSRGPGFPERRELMQLLSDAPPNLPKIGTSRSPRDLDRRHLKRALADLGFDSVHFRARRIHARRGAVEWLMDRSGSSMFAANVVQDRAAFELLLTEARIPVTFRRTLERSQLPLARTTITKALGPWRVRARSAEDELQSFFISDAAQFDAASSYLTADTFELEQSSESHTWKLLVVRGEVISCLAATNPTIVGDGRTSTERLIREKVRQRSRHPFLRHFPIPRALIDGRGSSSRDRRVDRILRQGQGVVLGYANLTHDGADTIAVTTEPDSHLVQLTNEVLRLIGEPPIASITLLRRSLRGRTLWAVADVDVDPLLSEFAQPLAGVATNVYSRVASALGGMPHYELST